METRTFDGVTYAPGKKFRVVQPARLEGQVPHPKFPGSWTGWKQVLMPGDVVECRGYRPGWGSDPGYGIHWTSERARSACASFVELRPGTGTIFSFRPEPGLLEPIADIKVGDRVRGQHVKGTRHYTGTVQNVYGMYNQVSVWVGNRTYMLLLDTCETIENGDSA